MASRNAGSKAPAAAEVVQATVVQVVPSAQPRINLSINIRGQIKAPDARGESGLPGRRGFTALSSKIALLLVFLILLAACQRDEEQSAELFVFGTLIEIKLWGASPEEAGHAFSELQQMFQGMHQDWHAWEPGRLTNINNAFAQGRSGNRRY